MEGRQPETMLKSNTNTNLGKYKHKCTFSMSAYALPIAYVAKGIDTGIWIGIGTMWQRQALCKKNTNAMKI